MQSCTLVTKSVFQLRYVLDGWPLTKAHVDLLTRFHITPVCIVELEVGDQEVLRRGEIDRGSPNRWGSVMYMYQYYLSRCICTYIVLYTVDL